MELLRITRQIHCKAVEKRATLIHRQYNRDWGTSYSRPPIDPYLTFPLLQNPGGATAYHGLGRIGRGRSSLSLWHERLPSASLFPATCSLSIPSPCRPTLTFPSLPLALSVLYSTFLCCPFFHVLIILKIMSVRMLPHQL